MTASFKRACFMFIDLRIFEFPTLGLFDLVNWSCESVVPPAPGLILGRDQTEAVCENYPF